MLCFILLVYKRGDVKEGLIVVKNLTYSMCNYNQDCVYCPSCLHHEETGVIQLFNMDQRCLYILEKI